MSAGLQYKAADNLGNVVDVSLATPLPVLSTATAAAPMPVSDKGSAAIATAQVTVGTGNTQIVPARAGRNAVTIENNGTGAFYVGNTGLTVGNGYLVPGVVGASVTIPTQGAVFGIAPVAQSVSVLETF